MTHVTKRQKLIIWLFHTSLLFGLVHFEVVAHSCMSYVSNSGDGTVSVIDTSNNNVVATIPVRDEPAGLAINPNGTRVYVANTSSNRVSVIDTSTHQVLVDIVSPQNPTNVVVSSDGTRVYVANTGNRVFSRNFSVIDAASNTVIATTTNLTTVLHASSQIPKDSQIPTEPTKEIVCGTFIYTANSGSNTINVTDVYTKNTVATITVGKQPKGLAAFVVSTPDKPTPDCSVINQAKIETVAESTKQACKTNPISCGIVAKINGISANAFVSPTHKITAGVAIAEGGARTLVRAISIDGIVDPMVEIYTHPSHKLLHSNNSWLEDPYATTELAQKGLIPPRSTDAATVLHLPSGLFTMEVTSKNGESGLNIIEIYDMDVFP